jgi:hypothetical protein
MLILGGNKMAYKTPTTITGANGTKQQGYIDNGKTYYSNGSRIENGATVTDNSGREWKMTSNGGVATGNNYSISGNQGAYKGNAGGSSGGSSNYYNQYQSLLDKQLKAQQDAIDKQTQTTVNSINAYKPKVEQSYANQQKANYIANARGQAQMGDYLGAMGYSGGMAESTMANLNNTYQNNRATADTEKNNAMLSIDQQAAQAKASGDTSLADAANTYYTNYLSTFQNQQQFDYQKQLQEQQNYTNTVGANANDYMAEAQRLIASGIPEDDYRVRLLLAKHYEKEASQQANQTTLSPYIAWQMYNKGIRTQEVLDALNM